MNQYNDDNTKQNTVCLEWGNLTIANNIYFQNIILSKYFT